MKQYFLFIAFISTLLSCKKESNQTKQPVIITATGDIVLSINEFRNLLGPQLNNTTGATTGRREINWDGVPDSLIGRTLPADFFNPVSSTAPEARKKGLTYSAAGGGFRVSNNNFADINPSSAPQFQPFSGNKIFTNISSNLWQIKFQVAGQTIPATVKGFGAVFSDVDIVNSTALEFFNGEKSLGKYFVPPHTSTTGFSFLGVHFQNGETVTAVAVSHQGNIASGEADISNNGTSDLVVLDDFFYSEPLAQ